ncbi:hypothetical protein GJV56_18810 [Elizabethkingia anophelis]|uniref:hypothetical protein n=1 Tax=Elizabethkingia anophelis TaxID=1117645 RepID=UPI0012B362C0|nr:hypothetical protein [Elizabethkingia anophelis]QGN24611.1 hypothetical protein GJV56_18810 [Elizabethkingia anophelis]
MKRLEEIKNKYAIEKEYYSWDELLSDSPEYLIEKYYDKVTELYAREVAQASLEKAAENLVQAPFSFNSDFNSQKIAIRSPKNITLL